MIVDWLRCFIAADRRAQFEKLEYTEDDYQKELEHIEQVKPWIYKYMASVNFHNYKSPLLFDVLL